MALRRTRREGPRLYRAAESYSARLHRGGPDLRRLAVQLRELRRRSGPSLAPAFSSYSSRSGSRTYVSAAWSTRAFIASEPAAGAPPISPSGFTKTELGRPPPRRPRTPPSPPAAPRWSGRAHRPEHATSGRSGAQIHALLVAAHGSGAGAEPAATPPGTGTNGVAYGRLTCTALVGLPGLYSTRLPDAPTPQPNTAARLPPARSLSRCPSGTSPQAATQGSLSFTSIEPAHSPYLASLLQQTA